MTSSTTVNNPTRIITCNVHHIIITTNKELFGSSINFSCVIATIIFLMVVLLIVVVSFLFLLLQLSAEFNCVPFPTTMMTFIISKLTSRLTTMLLFVTRTSTLTSPPAFCN
ncbi:hypothetical protein HanXRQr2_Chr13g0604461 [Helianthus annuus]|uniref:Uncharacterized protein n=1 Tax=Helianthus annuus TaxID=4232 RepID=A0A9K3EKN2_HELAN|nr:hypothetical protein HanXRQr2_Chr13g0604451 [Helianthus annuus]KAF5774773.1 hypothetical protein HanXRQr2_Chr13g0604461 [Helianthus annuus]KAJ0475526.1 hypothetical protein HanHA300_Chr13g0466441 [Helianthus annuus]KAJ0498906.1 hypothetical protein HanHA89_Chr13g0528191 [Helianthus annuus]KAJ0664922.1 hypothetical protein HanLR1_Chr13g0498231 [Helianthus annuus]